MRKKSPLTSWPFTLSVPLVPRTWNLRRSNAKTCEKTSWRCSRPRKRGTAKLYWICGRPLSIPSTGQAVAFRDGEWPQQEPVDHGEDGGVCADSEGQRKNGNKRKAGRLAQDAEGEAYVATEILKAAKLPQFAQALVPAARIAKGATGLRICFGLRNALPYQLVLQHDLMKGKLVGHVAVEAPFLKDGFQAKEEFVEILSHGCPRGGPQDACMTNATAEERRAQRCASALSFFWPSVVAP